MVTRRTAILALGSLALSACASRSSSSDTIRDVRSDRLIDEAELSRVLRPARYRLLGEVHDNPHHHAIRARLVDALGRSGLKPAVAFEQFDAERALPLQSVLSSGRATADAIAEAVHFDRKGWNWDFYRPIVEAAMRHGMPLRAAGLSQAKAREARMDPWPSGKEEILRNLIHEGHCRALPDAALPRMVSVQRARDRTMAEVLLQPSPDGAVLIAGNGHVRMDVGVPYYLPPEGVVTVGFLEEAPQGRVPFDFVWVTAAAPRPDPCEAFRRRK
jgi:uncharacterized iron-regulated protein